MRFSTQNFLWVLAASETDQTPSRLGITASRRVGNAVRRNRVKRIVRAAFLELDGMVPEGFDLVVICKSAPADLNTETVVQQWGCIQTRVRKAVSRLRSKAKRP